MKQITKGVLETNLSTKIKTKKNSAIYSCYPFNVHDMLQRWLLLNMIYSLIKMDFQNCGVGGENRPWNTSNQQILKSIFTSPHEDKQFQFCNISLFISKDYTCK